MATGERLLIAEDDPDMRDLLQEVLEDAGYRLAVAVDGPTALGYIRRERETIDLVVTDIKMPGSSGDDLLAASRANRPEVPVIIITAFGSVQQAVEMVKAGAFQYLTKPFDPPELLSAITDGLEKSAPQREQARLRRELPATPTRIIGASRPMRELYDLIGRAARSSSTILITGESGTGKELVARAVHETSERKGAFIPVNCAAIPADLIEAELFGHTGSAFTGAKQTRPGLFEAADGGTLFLDEIGELPMGVQPKLLRALQDGAIRRLGADRERIVNVRMIAATNRDLEKDMDCGRFRQDLFWRLNVINIHVPPLRERSYDVPLLVEHFIGNAGETAAKPTLAVSPDALAILTAYSWPGNVRELENAMERAVAFANGTQITAADLPKRILASGGAAALIARARQDRLTVRELEREYILDTLRSVGGNKSRAAELLGLDRRTLYRKLDEYRLEDPSLES
jgi:DNA-binding NtrC family response regulator